MTTLKPLSPLERKFLAKLGESPAQHQAQVLLKQTVVGRNSTSKLENVHAFNKEVERKLVYSEPSSEIAARLNKLEEEKQREVEDSVARARAVEWVPEAYVLFIRHSKCLSCRSTDTCLDHASLFIRCRPRIGPKEDSRKMYIPTKILPSSPLPRLMESRVVTLPVCENCFERAKPQCQNQTEPLILVQAGTSFLRQTTQDSVPHSSSSSPSASESPSGITTAFDGFSSEIIGSDSASSSPSPSAPATESPSSPTDEALEDAEAARSALSETKEAACG